MEENKIYLSSSPHFTKGASTQKIMLSVIIALLPECVAGVVFFGLRALITIAISVVSCVVFEWLFDIITKRENTIKDLSACVSGLLLSLALPPATPFWMTILGALVAMVVAKGLFGGIGANVFNPALTGRAFMFISFPVAMGATWSEPFTDAVSSATVLSNVKAGREITESYLDLFLGNTAGCIGETSALLILISFIFLLCIRVVDARAPLAMVITVALCTLISGEDVLVSILAGGLLFGAVFMTSDYATTPVTKTGRIVFGVGAGLITFLIRRFGGYPEGTMFAILIMNALTPFLNNLTGRKYGYGKTKSGSVK